MAQKNDVTLDPTIKQILSELGRSQVAYKDYGQAGRADLQAGAHSYADQVRKNATDAGIDLSKFGTQNQFGQNFEQYYTAQGPAGNYDPSKAGQIMMAGAQESPLIDQSGVAKAGAFTLTPTAPTPTPAPTSAPAPAPITPPTTPLPSSTGMGQQVQQTTHATPIDWTAIRSRAGNDAKLQVQLLLQTALQNKQRFERDANSQISNIHAMYNPQYEQNKLNTNAAARDAVQGAANRGFYSSGLSASADEQARLAGEHDRMALQGQETAQVGDLQGRVAQANTEYGDMSQNLSQREAMLSQSLADQYGKDERGFDLQNRQLSSDSILKMMGLDQQYGQFNDRLNFDKLTQQQGNTLDWAKLGQQGGQFNSDLQFRKDQLGQQNDQFNTDQRNTTDRFGKTLQDNNTQREWLGKQSAFERQNRIDLSKMDNTARAELQASTQTWQAGQASLDRVDARTRFNTEMGLRDKWDQAAHQLTREGRRQDSEDLKNRANSHYLHQIDDMLTSKDPADAAWKTYDGAVRGIDKIASVILADGGDPSVLMSYARKQFNMSDPNAGASGGGSGGHPIYSQN